MEISKPDVKFNINEELFRKYWRILKLARTPKKEEFSKIALVAAAGVIIVGVIGFLIYEGMLVLP
ncbi:MAG TPA: protein translocase SEC61 complex subunit gamma [Methanoregulaceae archaeon]|jgi:protein transport protein SEC61 subunit gamma-like protein|nr:protein translocase SEC61 complex subunit gamma [Methanolinea sp.]MCC7566725.1 protein translocase SEC61 complex subunit gamma [Methanoregulaceae archaeon]MDD3091106.1 protein translocase SEC61 complex subunit gamma [Methanoregulaceae archaeon]MDD5048039.1 protein translocase SEC61 complex subunit gamma [Methanoregulaceae archaeon]MDD5685254.1 protein translocase SEC61 complex subunit gamma [Methanoregulaceae archaeon]